MSAGPQSKEPSNAITVLLFGAASGYLGGTVLQTLLDLIRDNAGKCGGEDQPPEYRVSLFARAVNSSLYSKLPVNIIEGNYSELGLIESSAAAHDVVINAGSSDDLALTRAVNRGLAQRRAAGAKGVLVHVSGTRLIEGPPVGRADDTPVYNDMDVQQIENIRETACHRLIDLEIKRADQAGEIVASIICPGIIYAAGRGPGKKISGLYPSLIRSALQLQKATYAAEGTNVWPVVHVQDVADLIILSMQHNLQATTKAGFERFYFAENGESDFKSKVEKMAKILHGKQALPTDETQWLPCADPRSGVWSAKTNSRCVAERARNQLGWQPKFKLTDEEFEKDVLFTLPVIQGYLASQA